MCQKIIRAQLVGTQHYIAQTLWVSLTSRTTIIHENPSSPPAVAVHRCGGGGGGTVGRLQAPPQPPSSGWRRTLHEFEWVFSEGFSINTFQDTIYTLCTSEASRSPE